MGIGFVLLFWAAAGTVFAAIGTVILRRGTAFLTRRATEGRHAVVLAATALPFACVAWGAAIFAVQWSVNERVLHRDAGIGDVWKCPLPNGYALLMSDIPDRGWVYVPRTQPVSDAVVEQDDAIQGVRKLQVASHYIALGVEDYPSAALHSGKPEIDSYFLLDTSDATLTQFSTPEELRSATAAAGFPLALAPIRRVYARCRFTWFDWLAGALFLGPPLLAAGVLGARIVLLRRHREPAVQPI